MKEIIVHIGPYKTGSTAIQSALRENVGLLIKNGYYFVPESIVSYPTMLLNISTDDIESLEKEKQKYQGVIENAKADKVIFSSERYSGWFLIGYSNAQEIARKLHYMIGDYNVKIVIYLRRHDQLLESAYAQHINLGESLSFEDFKNDRCRHIDWFIPLAEYAKYFGDENIIVRVYEAAQLKDGDVVSDFFSILRIPLQVREDDIATRQNWSYSRSTIELARICNRHLNKEDRTRLRYLLQITNSKQPFEEFSFFTLRERRELLAYYEQSYTEVAKRFLGREDGSLFMEPVSGDDSSSNKQRSGLSTDELAVLIMNIIIRDRAIARTSNARPNKLYTAILVEEMERLILRLLGVFRLKGLLYRCAQFGLNVIRKI